MKLLFSFSMTSEMLNAVSAIILTVILGMADIILGEHSNQPKICLLTLIRLNEFSVCYSSIFETIKESYFQWMIRVHNKFNYLQVQTAEITFRQFIIGFFSWILRRHFFFLILFYSIFYNKHLQHNYWY